MPTLTQMATHQTAGPLAIMGGVSRPEIGCHFLKQPKEE